MRFIEVAVLHIGQQRVEGIGSKIRCAFRIVDRFVHFGLRLVKWSGHRTPRSTNVGRRLPRAVVGLQRYSPSESGCEGRK